MQLFNLHIDNWVRLPESNEPVRVREVAMDERGIWYVSYPVSATLFRAYNVRQIQLTRKILEDNEWKYNKRTDSMVFDDGRTIVTVEFAIDGWVKCIGVIKNGQGGNLINLTIKNTINYVDEFQRLLEGLRLDGIISIIIKQETQQE